jgi:hypothetical protein
MLGDLLLSEAIEVCKLKGLALHRCQGVQCLSNAAMFCTQIDDSRNMVMGGFVRGCRPGV